MTETKNSKSKYLSCSFKPLFMAGVAKEVRIHFLNRLSDINAQDNAGMTMAMWGAYYGDIDVLQYCKARHADFNIQDEAEWTPIMLSVREKQDKAVEYLLNNVKNIIDLNKKNIDGKDVFQLANDSTENIKGMLYSYLYAKVKNPVAEKVKDANVITK